MRSLLVCVFGIMSCFFLLLMRDNGPAYSWAPCQHVPPSPLPAGAVVAGVLPDTAKHTHTLVSQTTFTSTVCSVTHLEIHVRSVCKKHDIIIQVITLLLIVRCLFDYPDATLIEGNKVR